MGIQKYNKQKITDRSDQQKLVNRAKCATLYRKYRDREWILDDESYFTRTHSIFKMEMTISTRTT